MTNTIIGNAKYPELRMRRLRSAGWARDLVAECALTPADLIWPLFVIEDKNQREDIPSMPGVYRYSIDLLTQEAIKARDLGIPAIALFPVTPHNKKSEDGAESYNPDNLICRALQAIKAACPDIGIITDVALDPYTSHGHDGILRDGHIINDETVDILARQALTQAQAGADIIAPSDMMDGRIGAIRSALDAASHEDTMILSYAAKYASAFYGPFRDAVGSGGVLKGDKKTYQMDPRGRDEALREIELDINEGADMVMVKPGAPYLDIITCAASRFNVPLFAYHVSGEYAMMRAAAEKGWLEYDAVLLETLLSFKRAGVRGILTYGAMDAAKLLQIQ